ncbi:MAG: alkaline phosphatase D family protein, partial [Solirubrobacteraceae bacterium]|nr:alkaline phosphatase D family protein [Solirubrobacteraceae bacterium]
QGWGINPEAGGYRIFDAMGELEPDFFLCSGDTVYADGPLQPEVTLPDGRVWKNLVTPAKSKVAETLDEYRGVLAYNLLDEPLRRFNARVAQVNQWDDHEVHNNWWPGEILSDVRYTERRADVLAARGRQAFLEYLPVSDLSPDRAGRIYRKISHGPLVDVFVLDMRTYRDPNGANDYLDPERGLLGQAQRDWLKRELQRSRATWKVIANDLPVGLGVEGPPGFFEAVAQGEDGVPLGREGEIGDLLRTARRAGVQNIVFLTADVHNAYALHNDPSRAAVGGFNAFWEFVAGPLSAGAFPPSAVQYDRTFGQEVRYAGNPPRTNTSPLEGFQYFGHVHVDGGSQVMTVSLRTADGETVFSQAIEPVTRRRLGPWG